MSTHPTTPAPAPSSGRHRVDVAHLVVGLVLLGFVAAWGLAQADVVSGTDLRWLLPLPLLLGGAAGLVAVAVGAVRRHRPTETLTDTDTHTELTDELMTEETR